MLDLIFIKEENDIDFIEHAPAVGKSDHDCLLWTYISRSNNIESTKEKLNYAKRDYSTMKHKLANVSWKEKMDNNEL